MLWLALLHTAAAGPADVHLDALAGTTLPVDLGVRTQLELPHRLRTGLHLGWMPPAYVDLVNEISTSAGWYDQTTADLISIALDDALVVGFDLGWRPHPRAGFFFDLGYQVAALGGDATSVELVEAMAEVSVPMASHSANLRARSTLHMATVNLGWEQVVAERLVLRFTLGGTFTLAARSRITRTDREPLPAAQVVYDAGAVALSDTMERYVHAPTVGVHVGYRFF